MKYKLLWVQLWRQKYDWFSNKKKSEDNASILGEGTNQHSGAAKPKGNAKIRFHIPKAIVRDEIYFWFNKDFDQPDGAIQQILEQNQL